MSATGGFMRLVRRNGWVSGLFVLLALLLVFTRLIQPNYGSSGVVSLAAAALPFAFATAAQTVVVIAGGVDLSVASMMAVASVTAAVLMDGASEEFALLVVPLVLLMGLVMGAINGALIVLSRVPDIVVTLAMLFVWEGVALLILASPGGGAAQWLRALIIGTVGVPGVPDAITDWIPKALVLLIVCIAVVWIPLSRSRLGLSIYAIGSNQLAAFRSGVAVGWTRVAAYALAGLFAAMGGLALTMSTGIGAPIPGPYLLASVAAVVLGGVALGGGRGGIVGPIVAVFILRLVRTDLTFLSVDPNVTTIIEGTIMVAVVMLGALLAMRSRST
jgi:ribose transport system permease protein